MPDQANLTVRVRMYRQGLGDCHLVTILDNGEPVYRIMIDCGIYQTASGGAATMRKIVTDIIAETGGYVDLLAVTHEHWDHVSGFNQARALFIAKEDPPDPARLRVGEVWLGWTENDDDQAAARIKDERGLAVRRLAAAHQTAKALAPDSGLARGIGAILGFFDGPARTTAHAMDAVKALAGKPRYCKPTDPPREVVAGVRAYVLGPPLEAKYIYKLLDDDETYHLSGRAEDALFAATSVTEPDGRPPVDDGQPFDWTYRRAAPFLAGGEGAPQPAAPAPDADVDAFFARYYVGAPDGDPDQSWRRIDGDWLNGARNLALKLDNATNNTSLVLAFELVASGRVLLFVADAQVGSWLSWQDLEWNVDGKVVRSVDLLARTRLLKVGHHGSHNATLRGKGLERMDGDLVAFIPVDEALAKKVGWGRMPLPGLVDALTQRAKGRVVRTDRDFGADPAYPETNGFARALVIHELYYEFEFD